MPVAVARATSAPSSRRMRSSNMDDGGIAEARVLEARVLVLEAGLGLLGARCRRSPASGRALRTSRRTASAARRRARAASRAASLPDRSVRACFSVLGHALSSARRRSLANKKPGSACPSFMRKPGDQVTGSAHGPFSELFNVAASRPAKSPRVVMIWGISAFAPLGVKGRFV